MCNSIPRPARPVGTVDFHGSYCQGLVGDKNGTGSNSTQIICELVAYFIEQYLDNSPKERYLQKHSKIVQGTCAAGEALPCRRLAWIIRENTVGILLVRKIPCEQPKHCDNRTFMNGPG